MMISRNSRWPRLFGAGAPDEPGDQKKEKGPSLRVKRFMARYIVYLEIFGFVAVTLVALAIVACFFVQVDDVIRISGDPVAIKPRAEVIKREAGVLVTRVFVQNYQQVKKGDPLIEVVETPGWMSSYLITRQMRALLDEFDAPGQAAEIAKKRLEDAQKAAREAALVGVKKAGPTLTEAEVEEEEEKPALPVISLTADEWQMRSLIQRRLAAWEAHEVPLAPRIVLRAPINGTVVVPDDLDFKKFDADAEILKVVDLDDLRITVKLAGDTVADARTGQKAIIRAIYPDYKTGVIVRGDTVPKGNYFWQKERVTSYSLLDAKLKDTVKEAFKDRTITRNNDIPFNVSDVTDVEINADLETVRLPSGDATKNLIQADAPAELELSGIVLEGKHLLTVQLTDVPPSVIKQARGLVTEKLQGKVVIQPEEPPTEGGDVPIHDLRIEAVGETRIIAKMKGENKEAKGHTNDLKGEAARKSIRGGFLERLYEATVQIENPPPFLKARVLELLEQGKEVKAKVDIRTGRRAVAFLLLKR